MLRHEFETLAKRSVTYEQWKMIEGLYMESTLNKYDFVKSIKSLLKTIPVIEDYKIVNVGVLNKAGSPYTPNGCYYNRVKAYLIDVDIETGCYILRMIDNSFDYGYDVDINAYAKVKWL